MENTKYVHVQIEVGAHVDANVDDNVDANVDVNVIVHVDVDVDVSHSLTCCVELWCAVCLTCVFVGGEVVCSRLRRATRQCPILRPPLP